MSSSNFLSKFLSTEHLQGYTRFNAFFLPLSPPRAHTPCNTSCWATPILIFHYDGSCSVGSEGRAAYAQWKVGRGKRSPPAGVVISSVIFAHGTFIPSFPPFSNEQRARYRAYPPPGGTGRGMDLYRRGCCWPTFSSMGDLPARWEAKPKGFGDGNPRFDLVPTFNSKRYRLAILVPSDIRVYFNFFQSWTRFH